MEKTKSFEEKLKELESLVSELEDEGKGLEESVALYEKAKNLSKELSKELDEASKKVASLLEEDGSSKPFTPLGDNE